jgi:hypothetical protein
MQSTALQERMAVGQVQMQGAFLNSEQLVWNAAACIRAQYWDEVNGRFHSPLPDTTAVVAACSDRDVEPQNSDCCMG